MNEQEKQTEVWQGNKLSRGKRQKREQESRRWKV